MSRTESPEDRLIRLTAEAREAAAECAGLIKDLRTAMREAREQVDQYLGDEVQKAHKHYTKQWQDAAEQFIADMRQDVTGHITGWTAVVQNEVSRTAITKEAVDAILRELKRISDNAGAMFTGVPIPVNITWDLEKRT